MSSIKEWLPHLRPREKAIQMGFEKLSDEEVIALLLKSGTKTHSVMQIAQALLTKSGGLLGLARLSLQQCMQVPGIKQAKACELLAAFELSKRVHRGLAMSVNVVENPQSLLDWLSSELADKTQEHFLVVYLNTQNHIVAYKTLFIGTLDRSIIHPREVFKEAVTHSASRLIAVHNHPSGSMTPSPQDIEVTHLLMEAGQMMGIPLLDHLIVTNQGYTSLRQTILDD